MAYEFNVLHDLWIWFQLPSSSKCNSLWYSYTNKSDLHNKYVTCVYKNVAAVNVNLRMAIYYNQYVMQDKIYFTPK
jgi:hypothetical protein